MTLPMPIIRQIILSYLLAMVAWAAYAQNTITVATKVWDKYSESDGTGYYVDLLQAIFEPQGIRVDIKYVSFARSMQLVASGQADMMMGAYQQEQVPGLYAKYPTDRDVVDAVLSPALAASWQGLNSLKNMRVGAQKGEAFNDDIPVATYYFEAPDLNALLKMLESDRLDAVLFYEEDVVEVWASLGLAGEPLIRQGVLNNATYAVFADTESGKAYKKIYEAGLYALHQNGRLKKMMQQNARTLRYYPFQ